MGIEIIIGVLVGIVVAIVLFARMRKGPRP